MYSLASLNQWQWMPGRVWQEIDHPRYTLFICFPSQASTPATTIGYLVDEPLVWTFLMFLCFCPSIAWWHKFFEAWVLLFYFVFKMPHRWLMISKYVTFHAPLSPNQHPKYPATTSHSPLDFWYLGHTSSSTSYSWLLLKAHPSPWF